MYSKYIIKEDPTSLTAHDRYRKPTKKSQVTRTKVNLKDTPLGALFDSTVDLERFLSKLGNIEQMKEYLKTSR